LFIQKSETMKVIVTGVTGMVGEGVMHACLNHADITEVLIVGRRPYGGSHPKLKELVHADLYNMAPVANQLAGYDACYFCLGTTSVGKNEEEFTKTTYDLTLSFAKTLVSVNPNMTFTYISGSGTDSSEKGSTMWARVKGKTENDLLKLPFKQAYMFRPGYLHPTKGLKNTLPYYKYITWLYPVFKLLLPNMVSLLNDLGLAMIHVTQKGYSKSIIEVKDINILGKMG
jgi:uncharacterized protein YbjT (DUF2867 family)